MKGNASYAISTSPFYIRKTFGELSMSKFKAGDKVCKKFPNNQGSWDAHKYVTVDYVDGKWVYAKETGSLRVAEDRVKFYELSTRAKREELVAALRLVQSYKVGVFASDGELYVRGVKGEYQNPQDLVDVLIPLETPNQAKLRELEEKQRAIAEQMEQLRSEL
jgi:hypothetical protein